MEKVQYFPSSAKYEKFDLISIYFNHEVWYVIIGLTALYLTQFCNVCNIQFLQFCFLVIFNFSNHKCLYKHILYSNKKGFISWYNSFLWCIRLEIYQSCKRIHSSTTANLKEERSLTIESMNSATCKTIFNLKYSILIQIIP